MNLPYILQLVFLLAIGGTGAVLATKFKVPTAVFIGPIVFVAIFQVTVGTIMEKPYWLRLIVQIAVGIILGTSFTKAFFSSFKELLMPIIIVCTSLIGGGIIFGIFIHKVTGWDLLTSILATAPGGQAEMALLSDSVGGETEKVIVLQLVRNQLVIVGMLPLARYFLNRKEKRRLND